MAKALSHEGGPLAAGIHDRGDDDGQDKLHDDDAEPAKGADKPASRTAGVRGRLAGQFGDSARRHPLPQQDDLVTEQRNILQPQRRRRQSERSERIGPTDNSLEVLRDRRDREPERRDKYHQ